LSERKAFDGTKAGVKGLVDAGAKKVQSYSITNLTNLRKWPQI